MLLDNGTNSFSGQPGFNFFSSGHPGVSWRKKIEAWLTTERICTVVQEHKKPGYEASPFYLKNRATVTLPLLYLHPGVKVGETLCTNNKQANLHEWQRTLSLQIHQHFSCLFLLVHSGFWFNFDWCDHNFFISFLLVHGHFLFFMFVFNNVLSKCVVISSSFLLKQVIVCVCIYVCMLTYMYSALTCLLSNPLESFSPLYPHNIFFSFLFFIWYLFFFARGDRGGRGHAVSVSG